MSGDGGGGPAPAPGAGDAPPSVDELPRGFVPKPPKKCLNCAASYESLRRCSRCKAVYFCNATCQREVWKEHLKTCVPAPLSAKAEAEKAEIEKLRAREEAAKTRPPPRPPPPQTTTPQSKPEQVKADELVRVRTAILPEVDRLMKLGEYEDAIEHLDDGVAVASAHDERELLDSLSCLVARCYLRLNKPKDARDGLNPALMQARREGGKNAMKPHSIAAEICKAMGDETQMRVELKALMEAAQDAGVDAREQGAALYLAGCLLDDVGDDAAATPLLTSAADAAEKTRDHGMRAGAMSRIGRAMMRARKPRGAIDAWTDELRALDEGERADAEDALRRVDVSEEKQKDKDKEGGDLGEGGEGEKQDNDDDAKTPSTPPLPYRPLGDARARRCRAHANLYAARAVTRDRPRADAHLDAALSIANGMGDARDVARELGKLWLQVGHARRLASVGEEGEEKDVAEAYERAAAKAREAGDDETAKEAEEGLAKSAGKKSP
jgi:tetratricopeptide (TPR) repeat protein